MPDALMVTSSFLPGRGGIESFLAALCDELAPRVAVLAPARRDGNPIPSDLGYDAAGYTGSMLVPRRKIAEAVIETAAAHGTDRVLFGTPWPLLLLAPRLRRAGLRYAVIVHGAELLVPAAVPGLRRRLAAALAEADLILPVSEFTAQKIRDVLHRAQLSMPTTELLRARVDTTRFTPDERTPEARSRHGLHEDHRIILTFGRLVRRKGVDHLIDVLAEVRRRVPGAILVVAGTGPERRRLERRAFRTGGPVVFLGRVDDDDAPSLYASADVFSLPVTDRWFGLEVEGLGVVLLEAAASGVPCVAGRSGGTPEAVIDGVTGFVVDATDHAQLAGTLCRLLEDGEEARAMGKRGREHVIAEFSERPLPAGLMEWLA
jgi:phosphatidyl-myo-inositol dimannoside synthase